MSNNKEKKHNNQFKENTNHGEARNGRLSSYKNNSQHAQELNEYVTSKNEDTEDNLND